MVGLPEISKMGETATWMVASFYTDKALRVIQGILGWMAFSQSALGRVLGFSRLARLDWMKTVVCNLKRGNPESFSFHSWAVLPWRQFQRWLFLLPQGGIGWKGCGSVAFACSDKWNWVKSFLHEGQVLPCSEGDISNASWFAKSDIIKWDNILMRVICPFPVL